MMGLLDWQYLRKVLRVQAGGQGVEVPAAVAAEGGAPTAVLARDPCCC
jgi:hypothetical protein